MPSACSVPWWCAGTAVSMGRVRYQGGYTGGYTGRVIRVHPASPLCCEEDPYPAKRAPEVPARGWSGWDMGPGIVLQCSAAGTGISPPFGPVSPPVGFPGIYPWNAASGPIGRDSVTFLRNLVKTAECRHNSSKRPVIVPISKMGSRSRLLKF